EAAGSWLLFTDADTTHQSCSISGAISCAVERKIDFLTLAPETESRGFWEKTVQPLAVGSLALWFDAVRVNGPDARCTLANGQFILVKKEVYDRVGGNAAVRDQVVEDVELAKVVKKAGYKVRFLNGTRFYSTRMYSCLREIRIGWTRIFTYLFDKKPLPILTKILYFFFFSIVPYLLLALEIGLGLVGHPAFDPTLLALSATACLWIFALRFIGNRLVRCDGRYAVFHPLGSAVMIWILLCCLGRIFLKRPSVWRGDLYR
ncbi:MAG: glycosyltransferase, partial [Candidatus Omnitrophota bacterium]